MQAQGLNSARHAGGLGAPPRLRGAVRSRAAAWTVWLSGLFLAGLLLACAGLASGQANQSSSPGKNTQQNSKPAAQPPAAGQQPANGQQPAGGPMVMGESPDSTQDTGSSPAPPAANPAPPPAASPAPGTLVRWPPPNPPAAAPSAPAQPAAAPTPAVLVPAPANAGGDTARQQINDQCIDLLKMANDLKAAVDKSNKNVLSVPVVRKANEIERLAHQVKDEMKPAVGKN